jgi:hypothetical protein
LSRNQRAYHQAGDVESSSSYAPLFNQASQRGEYTAGIQVREELGICATCQRVYQELFLLLLRHRKYTLSQPAPKTMLIQQAKFPGVSTFIQHVEILRAWAMEWKFHRLSRFCRFRSGEPPRLLVEEDFNQDMPVDACSWVCRKEWPATPCYQVHEPSRDCTFIS